MPQTSWAQLRDEVLVERVLGLLGGLRKQRALVALRDASSAAVRHVDRRNRR